PINDISRKAGDLAISESLRRMESVCGNEDVVFRIGGDEFVLLTSSSDRAYAEGLQQKILAMNGQLIPYKGAEVPLKLYADLVKVDAGNLKYAELFPKLVISQEKKEEVL
ncbi:MAG: GGDEF domain-containing protein, partial [Treponema sp.]|nr:GGDEF domain-containing protein [Treponema sp.]